MVSAHVFVKGGTFQVRLLNIDTLRFKLRTSRRMECLTAIPDIKIETEMLGYQTISRDYLY